MTMTDAGVQDTDTPTEAVDEAVVDALTEAKLAFGDVAAHPGIEAVAHGLDDARTRAEEERV